MSTKTITAKKVYCWWNIEDENGQSICMTDEKEGVYGNSLYTTSLSKIKRLVKKYIGSTFELVTNVNDINHYEGGLDERWNKIIEVNGIVYKFLGAYYDERNRWNYGYVPLDEYDEYTEKCADCGTWIHQDNIDCILYNDKYYCTECQDEEEFIFAECCGRWAKSVDTGIVTISKEIDEDNFELGDNYITVCKDCLKEKGINVHRKHITDTALYNRVTKLFR